ncbi:hypothetical protein [Actinomadura harenae]|uniref:hypothetical protein n=1 Tax=Actinomadura harenae TaxID=2483351 RepID=UPI0011C4225D|nr:hypothetical protein [Actinomadura harenae]
MVVLTALVTAAVTGAVVAAAVPGSRTVWSDAVVPPDLERPDNVAADHRKAVIELPTDPNRFWGARDVSGLAACPQGWACLFQHRDFNAEPG